MARPYNIDAFQMAQSVRQDRTENGIVLRKQHAPPNVRMIGAVDGGFTNRALGKGFHPDGYVRDGVLFEPGGAELCGDAFLAIGRELREDAVYEGRVSAELFLFRG